MVDVKEIKSVELTPFTKMSASIYGVLRTPNESQWLPTRGFITCELVTLGKDRHNPSLHPT